MSINFPSSPSSGQIYVDPTTAIAWVFDGTAWNSSFVRSNYVNQTFTATSGQTTFTVAGGYLPGLVYVFRNGVQLTNTADFTATNGSTVVLVTGATVGDTIIVQGATTFSVANAITVTGGGQALAPVGGTVLRASTPFIENAATVASDYTISASQNAMSAGPITINAGITVTVPSGSTWTVV